MIKKSVKLFVVFFPAIVTAAFMLCGCSLGTVGDTVERLAPAEPANDGNISVPGYEKLSFAAGRTAQAVNLKNPAENNCTFVLTLSLNENGETLWAGKALSPGEAFTRITLKKALDAGEYPARLHYDCYTIEDNQPLNGAEIELTLEVH